MGRRNWIPVVLLVLAATSLVVYIGVQAPRDETSATITEPEAIALARAEVARLAPDVEFGDPTEVKLSYVNAPAVTQGRTLLVWRVAFSTTLEDGIIRPALVNLDAVTGKVLRSSL